MSRELVVNKSENLSKKKKEIEKVFNTLRHKGNAN